MSIEIIREDNRQQSPGSERNLRSHGHVLVVGDGAWVSEDLGPGLASTGFQVDLAGNGEEAANAVAVENFDAVVLCCASPHTEGRDMIRRVRERSDVPIIVVCLACTDEDRIEVLDLGANDVVGRISSGELQARLRAAIRDRCIHDRAPTTWRSGDVAIDFETRRATIGGRAVRLTQKETKFLSALAARPGRIASHRELITAIWGANADVDAQVVRVLAAQTRHKVEADPARPELILTEPGLGYRLKV